MTTDRAADALGAIADRLDDLWQLLDARLPPSEVMGDAAIARIKAAVMECAAQNPAQDGENAPLAGAEHDQAPEEHPQPATDAPEPAQTLADLTPCLGDRVLAAYASGGGVQVMFGYDSELGWSWLTDSGTKAPLAELDHWAVLEHLDPVTPEEPPVGAGMLVDSCAPVGCLRKRFDEGWRGCDAGDWLPSHSWEEALEYGPLRPATPADLAEHGVDEQGELVGKGEASPLQQVSDSLEMVIGEMSAAAYLTLSTAVRDALNAEKAGDRD